MGDSKESSSSSYDIPTFTTRKRSNLGLYQQNKTEENHHNSQTFNNESDFHQNAIRDNIANEMPLSNMEKKIESAIPLRIHPISSSLDDIEATSHIDSMFHYLSQLRQKSIVTSSRLGTLV